MRLLYDSVLPENLGLEAPEWAEMKRWSGSDLFDADLIREAADKGFQGLVLLGRDSLEQPDLQSVSEELGITLITAATDSPIEVKRRVIGNLSAIQLAILDHACVTVLATSVRSE